MHSSEDEKSLYLWHRFEASGKVSDYLEYLAYAQSGASVSEAAHIQSKGNDLLC